MRQNLKNSSLEEFLDNYIARKTIKNEKKSYGDWIRARGVNSAKEYGDKLKSITESYISSASGTGSGSERISSLGLKGSGYERYLKSRAEETFADEKERALSDYAKSDAENRFGYESYLAKLTKDENKSFESVVKNIGASGIMNFEDAYRYAVSAGLSKEAAASAAKSGSEIAHKNLRDTVIKAIINKSLGGTQTKKFALGLGLSPEEAEELAEYARSVNYYFYGDSENDAEDYLEGIKDGSKETDAKK